MPYVSQHMPIECNSHAVEDRTIGGATKQLECGCRPQLLPQVWESYPMKHSYDQEGAQSSGCTSTGRLVEHLILWSQGCTAMGPSPLLQIA